MTTPLYVRAAHHDVLPARPPERVPRERFVEYQRDLHRMAGLELDPASLVAGDQYTYVELADGLLDRAGAGRLAGTDVLVTSYWTPEFDPDVSAFGPYLHHRYQLACQSFDVIDQGSLGPVLALRVLGDYLRTDSEATDGVLLGVEQSTVPQPVGAHFPGPGHSSAGLVRLSREPDPADHPAIEVVAAAGFSEAQVLEPDFGLAGLAGRWCRDYGVEPADLTVLVRRNTFLYRKWIHQHGDDAGPHRTAHLPPEHSCMGLFEWLAAVAAGDRDDGRYTLFVEEDVESLAAAAVLIRVGHR